MKTRARDAEHAIIVFTTVIKDLSDQNKLTETQQRQLEGLNLFKQQAYDNLLRCWEPKQASLHRKIGALVGEAKILRSYRTKIMKYHKPFKTKGV